MSIAAPAENSKPKIRLQDYLSKKPVAIRAKRALVLYCDSALKQKSGSLAKKSYSLTNSLRKNATGVPVLKLSNGKYLPAKKSYVSVPKLYQNPKKYHRIHYTRIKQRLFKDHPVVVWVSKLDKFPNHALLLTGCNKSRIYYNDPWTGKRSSMTAKSFWKHYSSLHWLGGSKPALSY